MYVKAYVYSTHKLTHASNLALLTSRHPNDVRLVFPREGRELWTSSTLLTTSSPYFRTLFSNDSFSEAATSRVVEPIGVDKSQLTFEDSDDDESPLAPIPFPQTPTNDVENRVESCDTLFQSVRILDATHKTYEAVLSWLATGLIVFAPPTSKYNDPTLPLRQSARRAELQQSASEDPSSSPRVSAKSIYRLAHYLELVELEQLALAEIKGTLLSSTVAYELFSDMAPAYETFRTIVVDFAVANWDEVKTSIAMLQMQAYIESGKITNASAVLISLAIKRK